MLKELGENYFISFVQSNSNNTILTKIYYKKDTNEHFGIIYHYVSSLRSD